MSERAEPNAAPPQAHSDKDGQEPLPAAGAAPAQGDGKAEGMPEEPALYTTETGTGCLVDALPSTPRDWCYVLASNYDALRQYAVSRIAALEKALEANDPPAGEEGK